MEGEQEGEKKEKKKPRTTKMEKTGEIPLKKSLS